MSSRTFEAKPARREATPLIIGIVSPSGGGKTKSALRLVDGFARVTPGPIVVVDTEAKRALHHADSHRFIHIDMTPPFGPSDHIAAWSEAMRHRPMAIIQDSMTHEWEGPGGVLEMHSAELDRMAGNDWNKRERCNMAAWIRPKAEHTKMKHFILQQRVNWIFCFRAKEKIKPQKGGEPLDLGWQALGAEDLIYEMLLKVLLFPGAEGKPTWRSDKIGEQALMKLPGWFRDLFATPRQLDEDIGEQLARWAAGGAVVGDVGAPMDGPALIAAYAACTDEATMERLKQARAASWPRLDAKARELVLAQVLATKERVDAANATKPMSPEDAAEIARQERQSP